MEEVDLPAIHLQLQETNRILHQEGVLVKCQECGCSFYFGDIRRFEIGNDGKELKFCQHCGEVFLKSVRMPEQ